MTKERNGGMDKEGKREMERGTTGGQEKETEENHPLSSLVPLLVPLIHAPNRNITQRWSWGLLAVALGGQTIQTLNQSFACVFHHLFILSPSLAAQGTPSFPNLSGMDVEEAQGVHSNTNSILCGAGVARMQGLQYQATCTM
jgi:hypothetical protein